MPPLPPVQVVTAACAASNFSWWRYCPSDLGQQSGSGNNWARGFHGYGPEIHDQALELVRREVRCVAALPNP